ncbi:MAG: hypothetical protein ACRCVD_15845 [Halioglobus sp.]
MKIAAPLLALTLLALTHSSHAADEGTAAVTALGELNGIALACKQPALVSRARNIIVTTAPKSQWCPDHSRRARPIGRADPRSRYLSGQR